VDHALDANHVVANSEQNHILTNKSQPGIGGKLWTYSIDLGPFRNFSYPRSKKTQHPRGVARAVYGYIFGYLFQIGGNQRR